MSKGQPPDQGHTGDRVTVTEQDSNQDPPDFWLFPLGLGWKRLFSAALCAATFPSLAPTAASPIDYSAFSPLNFPKTLLQHYSPCEDILMAAHLPSPFPYNVTELDVVQAWEFFKPPR